MFRDPAQACEFSSAVDWKKQRTLLGRTRTPRPPVPPKPAHLAAIIKKQTFQQPLPRTQLLSPVPSSQLTRRLKLRALDHSGPIYAAKALPGVPSLSFEPVLAPSPSAPATPSIPNAPPIPVTRSLGRQGSLRRRNSIHSPAPRNSPFLGGVSTPPPAPPPPPPQIGVQGIKLKVVDHDLADSSLQSKLSHVCLRHVKSVKRKRRLSWNLRDQLKAVRLRKVDVLREEVRRVGPASGQLLAHANSHFARSGLPEPDITDRMETATGSDGWTYATSASIEVVAPKDAVFNIKVGETSFAPCDVTAPVFFHGENPFGEYPWFDAETSESPAEGKILVVYSGACSVLQKAQNAQQCGAVGLVVISQFANLAPPSQCIAKDFDRIRDVNRIPVVSVSKEDGQFLIDQGRDKLKLRLYVQPSLRRAIGLGRLDLVEDIMDNPDFIWDECDPPPMWHAASLGEQTIAKYLANRGVELESRGPNGATPLMAAIVGGHLSTAYCLIDAGANVNGITESSETVLHLAMKSGLTELVMALLRAGANTAAIDIMGNSALSWAISRGQTEMAEFLLDCGEDVDINATITELRDGDFRYETLLYVATRKDHLELMKLLLENGADPSVFSFGAELPLHVAVANRSLEAVQLLLKYGTANPPLTATGWTPLLLATRNNNLEIMQALLDAGADPDVQGLNTGATPLYLAVCQSSIHSVNCLLAAGCNTNIPNHRGLTPIMAAIRMSSFPHSCFIALLKSSDNLDLVTSDSGLNALHWAICRNSETALLSLLDAGCNPSALTEPGFLSASGGLTPLHIAIMYGRASLVHLLLNAGADPNIADDDGEPPLVYLCMTWSGHFNTTNRRDLIKAFVSFGADIAVTDADGNCIVDAIYALEGHDAARSILMEYDPAKHTDDDGNTPLHRAALMGSERLWLLLVSCGAQVSALNKKNTRPLDLVSDASLQFRFKRLVGKRDVMISYSHKDKVFALQLRRFLEQHRITTWMDLMDPTGISGGSVWRDEIGDAIREASAMVAVLTETYQDSSWCMKELDLAKQCDTQVFPVMMKKFQFDADLKLRTFTTQIVNFEESLTGSKGEVDEQKFTPLALSLVDGLRDCLERRRTASKTGRKWKKIMGLLRSVSDDSAQKNQLWQDMGPSLPVPDSLKTFAFVAHGNCHPEHVRELMETMAPEVKTVCPNPAMEVPPKDIVSAIKQCDVFVPILSTASCKSDILRDQLAFAEDIEKPIVPIFLGELQMPAGFAYQLASTNSFSFVLHRKLSRQHGASSLTKTLKEVLRNPGGSAPPPHVGAAEAELKAAQAKVAALQQQLAEAQAIIRAQQQGSGPRQVQV